MMGIQMRGRVKFTPSKITTPAERATKRYYFRAGAFTRGAAKRLVRFRKNPATSSRKGLPPFTHGRRVLKRSVAFSVAPGEGRVLIGPAASWAGRIGELHEFGGSRIVKIPPAGFQTKRKYKVGDVGPVSTRKYAKQWRTGRNTYKDLDGSPVTFVHLTSQRQAAHANRLRGRLAKKYARVVTADYKPRPFMGPALAEVTPQLPAMWASSFK